MAKTYKFEILVYVPDIHDQKLMFEQSNFDTFDQAKAAGKAYCEQHGYDFDIHCQFYEVVGQSKYVVQFNGESY